MGNYWNDNYWRRHLAEPERMDIFEELWIDKHQEMIDKLNKGHALDLGVALVSSRTTGSIMVSVSLLPIFL